MQEKMVSVGTAKEKLIIYLTENDAIAPSWVVVDQESHIKESIYQGHPKDLSSLAINKEIIVFVPAESVLLTQVKLPKMNRARLAQALPFAIEEQLIAEVDSLHFAMAEYQAEGIVPVAVVAKEKLQHWISRLQAWNLEADIMLPSTFALPVTDDTWHMVVNDKVIVRMDIYQGFACDRSNIKEFFSIACASSHSLPKAIHIQNYGEQSIRQELNDDLAIEETFYSHDQWPINLAQFRTDKFFINLLQGDYKTKKNKYPETKKMWTIIGYLGIIWMTLLFLYPTISYFILRQRLSDLNQQIALIYKRNFPESSALVAPKMRMEEKLNRLNILSEENNLIIGMNAIAKAMLEVPTIYLSRLDYQNHQISLDLSAISSDNFSKFNEFLIRQGLQVSQQSANLIDGRMHATIIVRGFK